MNALSSLFKKLNRSKRYRDSFPAAVVKRMLPLQIRVLRKQRNWSQAQLAQGSNLTQGVISRAEDPDYGNLTINTLVRIAAGFDCAFIGRFVPFSELGKWYTAITDEKDLEVPSFGDDLGFATTLHGISESSAEWPPWTQPILIQACDSWIKPRKPSLEVDAGPIYSQTEISSDSRKAFSMQIFGGVRGQNASLESFIHDSTTIHPARACAVTHQERPQ